MNIKSEFLAQKINIRILDPHLYLLLEPPPPAE
jgi:hypothetical protein